MNRWIRAAQATLDDCRSRLSHVVMEAADGRSGFALFGGFHARHRLARRYLLAADNPRTRLVLHRRATADSCRILARRYGLVVFCGDSAPLDLAPHLLTVPVLVNMELPTPKVFEGPGAAWSRSAKANIARVKRGRFEFDVVRADERFAEFYQRMFRPSLRGRHGVEAYVDSRRTLARIAREPGTELLRVFQDGRWVAANLNQSAPDGYRLLRHGWLDGDDALLKSGVVAALYWFGFHRAAALGRDRILFGGCAPYLSDGILLYKGYWGGRLSVEKPMSEFHFLLEPSHPACRRFLQAHSILTMGEGGDFIVFSGRDPEAADVPLELRGDIRRWYRWRDAPTPIPAVTAEEVPRPLRPWLTLC